VLEEGLALACTEVEAGYGDARILNGVSIRVPRGKVVTVIGPNGSGKSTLLKVIVGLVPHWKGTTEMRSRDGTVRGISAARPYQLPGLGLAYVPQMANVFADMSVLENLQLGAIPLGSAGEARSRIEAVLDRFPVLRKRVGSRAGTLSGGQRQVLAIGRALVSNPAILLLDEPSAGIQPDLVDEIFADIAGLSREGLSILLVEQKARQALEFSDFAYVLEMGRNRFEGTGAALASDPAVIDLYLGVGGLEPVRRAEPAGNAGT